jgi:hypothetical protein
MRVLVSEDLTLPLIIDAYESRPRRTRVAAFVPIAVALLGVLMILIGGITVNPSGTTTVSAEDRVDPIVTGSIAPRDRLHDLIMLDR